MNDYDIMIDAAYQRGYSAGERGWRNRQNYEGQEWPSSGRDRDEWKHEAMQAMRLKR